MSEQPLVGIVIVNYNGAGYQNECIHSIFAAGYDNIRIIVVDNASTDGSMELLNEFQDERIIKIYHRENGGVAQGNNIGIRKSIELGCEYSLLLNNDTVVTPGFLQKLVNVEKDIVCPKIYYYNSDKIIWYGGGKFVKWKGNSTHLHFKKKDEGIKYKKYYDYAPTCCLLINNRVFGTVGEMDEKYFLYYDDSDFLYRANKKGYKVFFCPESVIFHKVSLATGGDKSPTSLYYSNRNRFYFIKKNKLGLFAKLFAYFSRKIKILISKIKRTTDWIYIREGMKDFKNGKMYRKEDLKKLG